MVAAWALWALWAIPVAALRENHQQKQLWFNTEEWKPKLKSIEDPKPLPGDCEKEAEHTRQVLQSLGSSGSFHGDHCRWPGVTCHSGSLVSDCLVKALECRTCAGTLPSKIHLKFLQEVEITSSNLTGDIKVFAGLDKLKVLNLQGTQVHGNIESLGIDRHFQKLNLRATKVHGNLRGLRPASIIDLDLSDTMVTGALDDLIGFVYTNGDCNSQLEALNLRRTPVTGDMTSLSCFRRIKDVDLSYTQVTGRINEHWRGRLSYLRTLRLRNSRVQFIPEGPALSNLKQHFHEVYFAKYDTFFFPHRNHQKLHPDLLPKLEELDITNCNVSGRAEDLLLPLAMSPISSIQAVGAGISGYVPLLSQVEAVVNRERIPNFNFPLTKTLLTLDLSRNNVSELRGFPLKPKSGRLILRENQEVMVSPTALTEARKQEIFLDLTGTELSNKDEAAKLLEAGVFSATDMYAYRNGIAGYTCKVLVGSIKATSSKFLPQQLCKCFAGWHGRGATCQMCPVNSFSDTLGLHRCKSCPPNSTASAGSTKLEHCKCAFGSLHDGGCSCDKHHALQQGECVLCSKLHLQCNNTGSHASLAPPDVNHIRLKSNAEEAHRCLPPAISQRCPGGHHCGVGYGGTLCASCADGFRSSGGRCKPCGEGSSVFAWRIGLAGSITCLLIIIYFFYKRAGRQTPHTVSARHLLQRRFVRQAPLLLQLVQLWVVLSSLAPQGPSTSMFPEVPYLEILQMTVTELQSKLNLRCTFDAETVYVLGAIASPLLPLLVIACCAALECCRAGLGVSIAWKAITLLFIGGASSTAELLKCQSEDGDGEPLGDFAFRPAIPHLRCLETNGIALWVRGVAYGSAMAYGLLIPLFIGGLMLRQHYAIREARVFYAYAQGEPQHITLRLQALQGQLPKGSIPTRLLAAAAAHMAVHCRGKRVVKLYDNSITTSGEPEEAMKVADAETSTQVLKTQKLTQMLNERIILNQASNDRLLIGSQSLSNKYTLCQDLWMDVAIKLFALALVSCLSMSSYAWRWAAAFSLGMAVLVGVSQPYMQPQVSQLHCLSCCCLAVASWAFVYHCPWMARVALLSPFSLVLWQARCPDCVEALAERLYQELLLELPQLQRGEVHELHVELYR